MGLAPVGGSDFVCLFGPPHPATNAAATRQIRLFSRFMERRWPLAKVRQLAACSGLSFHLSDQEAFARTGRGIVVAGGRPVIFRSNALISSRSGPLFHP